MNAATTLVAIGEDRAAEWDAFVEKSAAASFFHRFGWRRVIERAYGHRGVYLAAARSGRFVGVLPLIDVRSPIFGRSLISTAFTVGGGIAAEDDAARAMLAEAAIEEGRRRRARYVELRAPRADVAGWATKAGVYAGFETPLVPAEDAALKAVPRKRRAEVRKAIDALVSGALAAEWSSDAGAFYPLYAAAMRDHGTPIFPRRFAAAVLEEFKAHTEVLTIRAGGAPALALMTFRHRDRVMPYYVGGAPNARECRAFDLAYWLTMRRAVEGGASVFDFGRSKFGTGSFDYKTLWGLEPQPLEYQYALLSTTKTPNVSPTNPKFAALSAAWKRLPLPLANAAGPMLARHLA